MKSATKFLFLPIAAMILLSAVLCGPESTSARHYNPTGQAARVGPSVTSRTEPQGSRSTGASGVKPVVSRLFFLEASGGGRVISVNPDGSDRKVIVTGCRIPDGVVVDAKAGHIYWTNMGV